MNTQKIRKIHPTDSSDDEWQAIVPPLTTDLSNWPPNEMGVARFTGKNSSKNPSALAVGVSAESFKPNSTLHQAIVATQHLC